MTFESESNDQVEEFVGEVIRLARVRNMPPSLITWINDYPHEFYDDNELEQYFYEDAIDILLGLDPPELLISALDAATQEMF